MEGKGLLRAALTRPLQWGVARVRPRRQVVKAVAVMRRQRPVVIAHRGFSAFAPENTLPAFSLALEAGADLVELDYRQSADAELIVIHDADLDRTTDARLHWGGKHIKVHDKTAWEIRARPL